MLTGIFLIIMHRGCVKRNKNTETQKHGALYFIGFQNKFSVAPSFCVSVFKIPHYDTFPCESGKSYVSSQQALDTLFVR